jgi:hypothetical protein
MVEPADLRQRYDLAHDGRLDGEWFRRVLPQEQVRSGTVTVGEVGLQDPVQVLRQNEPERPVHHVDARPTRRVPEIGQLLAKGEVFEHQLRTDAEDTWRTTPSEADAATTLSGTITLQLGNGCRGRWQIGFTQQSSNASFLDDNINAANPSWVLFRLFTVQGDPSLCFPGTAAPTTCADTFVATNVIVRYEPQYPAA